MLEAHARRQPTRDGGVPCYLETSGERNVEVYRRFGYEVVEKLKVPDPEDPDDAFDEFFCMVRPATREYH